MKLGADLISPLLERLGPSLTSDLARVLEGHGLTAAAARKRLSRLPEGVRILRGLPFPKRVRFIYLEEQFATNEYWDALIEAVQTSGPAYAAALAGLQARGGIVPLKHFDVASGAPVRQKRQLASQTVLFRLEAVSLLDRLYVEPIGECICLGRRHKFGSSEMGSLRARLVTERVLLDAVAPWIVKMNLASANKLRVRQSGPLPQFSTFRFDICGPSYLRPMTRLREDGISPGFVVGDVVVGARLDETHVEPFLRKCRTLSHLKKLRPFLPMLIADGFTPKGLHACRALGVMALTPSTIFGQDVARALKDLLETLSNAAAVAASNPERLEALFSQLSKVEGAAKNLRGALFEVVVGHMVRAIEPGSIDIGTVITDMDTGKRAELDVRLVNEKRVTIYECRGYQPTAAINRDEVEEWLQEKVPVLLNGMRQERRFSDNAFRFELWTCGKFHPQALTALREARSRIRKYRIAWKDGPAVRKYARELKSPGIRKILNEHYFNHPLAT